MRRHRLPPSRRRHRRSTAGAAESITPPADDRLPGNVRPSAYHVYDLISTRVAPTGGQVRIELQLTEATDTIWLHSENHEVYATLWLAFKGAARRRHNAPATPTGLR